MLPPTTEELREPEHRPYFLWWLDATVADLRRELASPDLMRAALDARIASSQVVRFMADEVV